MMKSTRYNAKDIRSLSDKRRHAIVGEVSRDIRGMRKAIKDLNTVHPLNMTEEDVLFKIQDLTREIAKANHYRLQLLYPGIETIYEDRIIEICGKKAIPEMVECGLIESCAVINKRKLYAI